MYYPKYHTLFAFDLSGYFFPFSFAVDSVTAW